MKFNDINNIYNINKIEFDKINYIFQINLKYFRKYIKYIEKMLFKSQLLLNFQLL